MVSLVCPFGQFIHPRPKGTGNSKHRLKERDIPFYAFSNGSSPAVKHLLEQAGIKTVWVKRNVNQFFDPWGTAPDRVIQNLGELQGFPVSTMEME